MESIGKKLKEARERNNYSLEQVARDTHISKNYIVALEEEDFGVLPGEPYVYGFLRNYAEYLALNPDELVSLYKNMRLQEQPMPINELLETRRTRMAAGRAVLIVLGVAVLAAAGYLVYRIRANPAAPAETAAEEQPAAIGPAGSAAELTFEDEALTRWFSQGDVIHVPVQEKRFDLKVLAAQENLSLQTPAGAVQMRVGEERTLDMNADSQPDVRLVLNDLDRGASRVNLGLYKITTAAAAAVPAAAAAGTPAAASSGSAGAAAAGAAAAAQPGADAARQGPATPSGRREGEGAGGEDAARRGQAEPSSRGDAAAGGRPAANLQVGLRGAQAYTILQAAEPAPYRVDLTFRGYCLFRYLLDEENREERFFQKGENFTLDVRKNVKLWVSNAGSMRLMVAGRDVEIGRPGEVVAWLIRWRQDSASARHLLEIVPVD